MGRNSTVVTHKQRTRIDTMLDDGVSYADIARTVGGTSVASIGRYALSRKSELAKIVDDAPGVTLVLSRLVEAADHARTVRRQSKLAGSPMAQSRAIKGEAEILAKLITELGIDDTSIDEALEEVQALTVGVRLFVRTYPDSAPDLLGVLSENPETRGLADALSAQIKNRN